MCDISAVALHRRIDTAGDDGKVYPDALVRQDIRSPTDGASCRASDSEMTPARGGQVEGLAIIGRPPTANTAEHGR